MNDNPVPFETMADIETEQLLNAARVDPALRNITLSELEVVANFIKEAYLKGANDAVDAEILIGDSMTAFDAWNAGIAQGLNER